MGQDRFEEMIDDGKPIKDGPIPLRYMPSKYKKVAQYHFLKDCDPNMKKYTIQNCRLVNILLDLYMKIFFHYSIDLL